MNTASKKIIMLVVSLLVVATITLTGVLVLNNNAPVSVTFITNGGTEIATKEIKSLEEIEKPSKEGYSFSGWYDNSSFSGDKLMSLPTKNKGELILYAKWALVEYSLIFNHNGGTGSELIKYNIESNDVTLPTTTKTGFSFGGWFADSNFSGTVITIVPKGSNGDKNYYAKWTPNNYVVSFNYDNANENDDILTVNVTFNSNYQELPIPVKYGYSFDGWYTATTEGTKVTNESQVDIADNHTLYARWNANQYTIIYHTNGGESIEQHNFTPLSSEIILESTTRTGYTFDGWYDNVNLGGSEVISLSSGSYGDKIYYAKWIANNYTVNFDYQDADGDNTVSSKEITFDSAYGDLPVPTKTGYIFSGWFTLSLGGDKIIKESIVNVALTHTIYAQWIAKDYTISFEYKGADGQNDLQDKVVSYDYEYGTLPEPTRTGYTFGGWFTLEDGGVEITNKSIVTIIEDSVLFAHWSANEYTLTFDYNYADGQNDLQDKTVLYDSDYGILPTPTRTGYTFKCWADALVDGIIINSADIVKTAQDSTIYAIWLPIIYDIIYNLNLGEYSGENSQENLENYTIITESIIFKEPIKEGYTFTGWYSDTNFDNIITGIELGSIGTVEIFAKWSINEYTLTFDSNEGTEVTAITQNFDTEIRVPEYPVKENYLFAGWYLDLSFENEYFIEKMPSENITIYAKWETPSQFTYEITYADENSYVTITGYTEYLNSFVTIPSKIEGYPVTAIADNAFKDSLIINTFVIPYSNLNIGRGILSGCNSIRSMTVPFQDSYNTNTNSYLRFYFGGNSYQNGGVLPVGLKTVNISEGTIKIPSNAFYGFSNLTTIILPDEVEMIGSNAFNGCSALINFDTPNNLLSIGNSAFEGCSALNALNFYSNLTYIGNAAFKNCYGITEINVPSNVTFIGNETFSGCSSLINIELYESLNSIGNYAFQNCSSLTELTIPASVTTIGTGILQGCTALETLTAPFKGTYSETDNSYLRYFFGGIGFNSGEEVPASLKTVYIADNGITSIGNHTFYTCRSLTTITLPETITSIGDQAFRGCDNLSAIDFPNSLTSIGDYAFNGCSALTTITLPDNLLTLGNSAFRACNALATITLPDSLTSIGDQAFFNCYTLTELTIPASVTTIGTGILQGCTALETLTAPFKGTYNETDNSYLRYFFGGTAFDIGVLPEGLTKVTIANGATAISEKAFYNCTSLESIILPEGITYIGDGVFLGNSLLKSIDLPVSLTGIGNEAFKDCTSLIYINMPSNNKIEITDINAFANTSNIFYVPFELVETYKLANIWMDIPDIESRLLAIPEIIIHNNNSDTEYSIRVLYNKLLEISAEPEYIGYDFAGWFTDEELLIPYDFNSIVLNSFNLYAKWTSQKYDLNFDYKDADGNNSETSKEVYYDFTIGSLPIPEKTGYEFGGWFTEETFENEINENLVYKFINNITIYAKWIPKEFVVTFEYQGADGEITITSINVVYDSAYGVLPVPTKTNYNFMGWFTSATEGDKIEEDTIVKITKNETIYAQWIGIDVTVTFDYQEADSNTDTQNKIVNYDALYGELPVPEKTGHTFIGWFNALEDGVKITSELTVESNTDHTLYAIWEVNQYTITFESNGGSVIAGITTDYLSEINQPAIPEKEGFDFDCWYLDEDLTQKFEFTTMQANDTILYAAWYAHGLTFILINEDQEYAVKQGTATDANIEIPAIYNGKPVTEIAELGFNGFEELISISLFSNINTIGANAFEGCISLKNVTLNENLKKIQGNAFKGCTSITEIVLPVGLDYIGEQVFANCTGLTSIIIPDSIVIIEQKTFENCTSLTDITFNQNVLTINNSAFANCTSIITINLAEGLNVLGDNVFENCSGLTEITLPQSLTSMGKSMFSNCTALTAVHIKSETLNLISENTFYGCIALEYVLIPSSLLIPLESINAFESSDNCLIYVHPTLVDSYKTANSWKDILNANTRIVSLPLITFETSGGNIIESVMVLYKSKLNKPENPVKEGYVFVDWYVDAELTELYDFELNVVNSFTLFAMWLEDTHNVLFNYDNADGGNTISEKEVTYSKPYGELPVPLKTGYTFNGWFTEATDGEKITEETIVNILADKTLFAQWTATIFTVTFNYNGADGNNDLLSDDFTYNSQYLILPLPTKTNFVFEGWFTSEEYVEQITVDTIVNITEDTTFFAKWSGKLVTVTYNYQNATDNFDTINKVVEYSKEYGVLPEPLKTGYTFNGWFTLDENGEQITLESIVEITEDTTLFAQWSANTYTVTFNYNGATENNTEVSKDITYNTPYGTLPIPLKTNYTFVGWYIDAEGEVSVSSTTIMETDKDTILYAVWIGIEVTIIFDYQGADGNNENENKIVNYDALYGELPMPQKNGYTFIGWFTLASEGEKITEETLIIALEDFTIFAQWLSNEYTITYNQNDGSGAEDSVYTIESEQIILAITEKLGYNFEGWFDNEEFNGSAIESILSGSYGNKIFYAKWAPKVYTVTFDYQDADGDNSLESKQVTYNDVFGNMPVPTKTGYGFVGWYFGNENSIRITSYTLVNITEPITVVAVWNENVYVATLNYDGADENNTVLTINVASNVAYGQLPAPSKTGYTFLGWFTSAFEGEEITKDSVLTVLEDHTIYAQWLANKQVVNLEYQGSDSVGIIEMEVAYDSTFVDLPVPVKRGHTFLGWFTAEQDGLQVKNEDTVKLLENITLYAQWFTNSYTVTFNYDNADGNNSIENITIVYGNTYSNLPEPTKTGYNFLGWFDNNNIQIFEQLEADIIEDITIKAIWEIKIIIMTFDTNGGTSVTPNVQEYGTNVSEPSTTRIGYDFSGWYGDAEFSTEYEFGLMPAENLTIYAKWTAINRMITFSYEGADDNNSVINKEVTYDDFYGTLPSPTKIGYNFMGWHTAIEDGEKYSSDTIVKITENITLYAVWQIKIINIIFDSKGGTSIDTISQEYNSTVAAPEEIPYYEGYVFNNWYSDVECTQKYTFTVMPHEDITLYGNWYTDGLEFTLISNDSAYSVSKGTMTAERLLMPNSYNGLPITAISANGFINSSQITEVVFPSGLLSIGASAFEGCSGLTIISTPNTITTIY
jgi:uncharacterized repeat protein (TIGR02543 family)